MSLVTIIWTAVITASLMWSGIQFSLWRRNTSNKAYLGTALALAGIAGIAIAELLLMRSNNSITAFRVFNWTNIATLMLIIGLTVFIRATLKSGSMLLAGSAIGFRLLGAFLIPLKFQQGYIDPASWPNIRFLGETVSTPSAAALSSWWFLNEIGNLLFILFVIHAWFHAWRKGDSETRRMANTLGISIFLFAVTASSLSFMINRGILQTPYVVSIPFLLVLLMLIREFTLQVTRGNEKQGLAKQKILQLRLRLREAEKSYFLGQMSSTIAHELGQPLGSILRNTETAELILQQASADTKELMAVIRAIKKDDLRAMQIIHKIHSLIAHRPIQLKAVRIEKLVEQVLDLARVDARKNSIPMSTDIPADLPPVRGDELLLQQVLLNLLKNAWEAQENQENAFICISARQQSADEIELSVTDDGPGIPEETRKHLFKPFHGSKRNGMGIGLAISRTIIAAHQGQLWLDEQISDRTVFRLTLKIWHQGESGNG